MNATKENNQVNAAEIEQQAATMPLRKIVARDAVSIINKVQFIENSYLLSLRSIIEAVKPYAPYVSYERTLKHKRTAKRMLDVGYDFGVELKNLSSAFSIVLSYKGEFNYEFFDLIEKIRELIKDPDYFLKLHGVERVYNYC